MNQRITNNNEKKLSEWAKRVEKIRRILAENNNNVFAERVGITPQLASALLSATGTATASGQRQPAGRPQTSTCDWRILSGAWRRRFDGI